MAKQPRSYIEHIAIPVRDIDWYVRFFAEAFGMTVRQIDGPADNPVQVWTIGGIQLVSDPSFKGPEGRLLHLGIITDDLEAAIERVEEWGGKATGKGPNWLILPDGLYLELLQASRNSVAEALAVDPRA